MSAVTGAWATSYGADLPYIVWSFEPPGGMGDAVEGNTVECRVRIDSSTSVANEGFALSVLDGGGRYTVFVREDGLNIQGEPNVAVVLNDKLHRVKFAAQNGFCRVWVDGLLRQYGTAAGQTGKAGVTCGNMAFDDW